MANLQPKSLASVLAQFPKAVRDRYDFTNVEYHGATVRMTGIVCREHGEFAQYSAQLRKDGAGCPACGDVSRRTNQRMTTEGFIARAIDLHGSCYDYSKVVVNGSDNKVIIICPEHREFLISPNNHLRKGAGEGRGRGCPECGMKMRGRHHPKNRGKVYPKYGRKPAL